MSADLITTARAWTDTPFQHHQHAQGAGTDCVGFIAEAAIACGRFGANFWRLPEVAALMGYGTQPNGQQLRRVLDALMDRVPVPEMQPGDVLLLRFGAEPQHVALLTGPATLIHAYSRAGRVVEHSLDAVWKKRICAMYRFREAG